MITSEHTYTELLEMRETMFRQNYKLDDEIKNKKIRLRRDVSEDARLLQWESMGNGRCKKRKVNEEFGYIEY